ncbi:MAG TPA: HD domain-containing phosphohydrolase [Syntrophobacteraceae bacterium]|nr:HD domain-containing phosphohydrolase [Syntrophobacteraceae bacterium]
MKILIVEDDTMLGELLQECMLRLEHERVRVCLSGQEALIAIDEESFDCAFVDLRLPDIDGLELLAAIKERDRGLPVVMMSGYPTMEYTIRAMREGASDFLTKPFTLQDVALTLLRITKERELLLKDLSLQFEAQARKQLEEVNRKLESKVNEQTRLFHISREIDEIRSSEDLYPRIVQLASLLESVEKVTFYLVHREGGNLIRMADCGWQPDNSWPQRLEVSEGRRRELLGNGATHLIIGPGEIQCCFENAPPQTDSTLSCWPMRIRGEPFGLLMAIHKQGSQLLASEESGLFDFLIRKASLAVENMALYESLTSNFYGILKSLVNALEARDLYTGKHSERVTRYATETAAILGCSADQIESMRTVGYLHDIGKIGVRDSILNKPGPLTKEEYEMVKKHPSIGDSIVSELGLISEERSIIRHHHERWDGKGYPDGLAGEQIPMLARIVSVVDAFDAMTSKRAYRDAMSREEAVAELRRNSGKQFDPRALEAFLKVVENIEDRRE